jgi:hypothetical protein
MIERHGDRVGYVLEGFTAANHSEEDIETKAPWGSPVGREGLTPDAAPLTTASSRDRG